MKSDASVERAVEVWQQRLAPLSATLGEVEPPANVWHAIEHALSAPSEAAPAILLLRRSRDRWRTAAVFAGALAAGLAVFGIDRVLIAPQELQGSYVAVVNRSGDQPALIVRVDLATRTVFVRPVATAVPQGHSLELWYIGHGLAPKSMGLVDKAERNMPLPKVPMSSRRISPSPSSPQAARRAVRRPGRSSIPANCSRSECVFPRPHDRQGTREGRLDIEIRRVGLDRILGQPERRQRAKHPGRHGAGFPPEPPDNRGLALLKLQRAAAGASTRDSPSHSIFASACGQITVPISRPSRTAPPGRAAKDCAACRRAPGAPRGWRRRSRPPHPCRGRAVAFGYRNRSTKGRSAAATAAWDIGKILPMLDERAGGGADPEQPGIEMRQVEIVRKAARQGALAPRPGARRSPDDHEKCAQAPPAPAERSGSSWRSSQHRRSPCRAFAASPRQRKLMAMRWSRCVTATPPPGTSLL